MAPEGAEGGGKVASAGKNGVVCKKVFVDAFWNRYVWTGSTWAALRQGSGRGRGGCVLFVLQQAHCIWLLPAAHDGLLGVGGRRVTPCSKRIAFGNYLLRIMASLS